MQLSRVTVNQLLKMAGSPLTKSQLGVIDKLVDDSVTKIVNTAKESWSGASIESVAKCLERRLYKIFSPTNASKMEKFGLKLIIRAKTDSAANRAKSALKKEALARVNGNPIVYPVTVKNDRHESSIKIVGNVPVDVLNKMRKSEYKACKTKSMNTSEKWKLIMAAIAM